jgi:cystathionine beta-synthase
MDITGFESLDESDLFQSYVQDKNSKERPPWEIMGNSYPIVQLGTTIEEFRCLAEIMQLY